LFSPKTNEAGGIKYDGPVNHVGN